MCVVTPAAGELVELGFGKRCRRRQHALGSVRAGSRVQPAAAHLPCRDAQLPGEIDDVLQDRSRFLLGREPQLAHPAGTSEQELAHRMAPLDLLTTQSSRRRLAWT